VTNIDLQPLVDWLTTNALAIVALSIGLLVVFRYARPLVHRVMRRLLVRASQQADPADAAMQHEEAEKRASTLEDLFVKVVRAMVVLSLLFLALTLLDLLPVLAGLAVIGAAITLAGQSIVLDYLMGILILAEGQYYRDDWIMVSGVEGTVEEVGLRRTVIRDPTGTVHSISNGLIRQASNKTRVYASLLVDLLVDQSTDIDRAVKVIDEVGLALAEDPEWRDRILEVPRFVRITAMTELGLTLRVSGRVRAVDRWAAPGELRRRLLRAFAEHGIEMARLGRIPAGAGVGADAPPAGPAGPTV
jgi:small conductance mechanosensitive channel